MGLRRIAVSLGVEVGRREAIPLGEHLSAAVGQPILEARGFCGSCGLPRREPSLAPGCGAEGNPRQAYCNSCGAAWTASG